MSKHTPRPWNYQAGYVSTYINGDYIIIAEVHSTFGTDNFGEETLTLGPKEREANGFLMAAAPEMYELLKSIDHALHLDLMNFDATDHRQVYDYAKIIRVLLAKIEGGGE